MQILSFSKPQERLFASFELPDCLHVWGDFDARETVPRSIGWGQALWRAPTYKMHRTRKRHALFIACISHNPKRKDKFNCLAIIVFFLLTSFCLVIVVLLKMCSGRFGYFRRGWERNEVRVFCRFAGRAPPPSFELRAHTCFVVWMHREIYALWHFMDCF